jgi:Protein of unknown function (DUF2510)
MQQVQPPPAGWYPDPEGGSRLRWWLGTDWSDRYRPPPTPSELQRTAASREAPDVLASVPARVSGRPALNRQEVDEIVSQVRQIARSEVDRAADAFSQRVQTATRQVQPLITEYTNKILRWVKIVSIVIVLGLIAWFVFQTVAQVTILEWLGDRIDSLTD